MSRDVLVIHTCYTRLRPPDLFESCVSCDLCMGECTCLGIILIHVWCPVTRDTCGVWCPYRVGLVRHVWPYHRCLGGILPCNTKTRASLGARKLGCPTPRAKAQKQSQKHEPQRDGVHPRNSRRLPYSRITHTKIS